MSVRLSIKLPNSGMTLIILVLNLMLRLSSVAIRFASFTSGSTMPSFFSNAENSACLFLIAASSRLMRSSRSASSLAALIFSYSI
jgi:hypothetical protein